MNPIQNRLERRKPSPYALLYNLFRSDTEIVVEKAYQVIQAAWDKDRFFLIGKNPMCILAGAVYIAEVLLLERGQIIGRFRTQRELSKALTVGEIALGRRFREIDKLLGLKIYYGAIREIIVDQEEELGEDEVSPDVKFYLALKRGSRNL